MAFAEPTFAAAQERQLEPPDETTEAEPAGAEERALDLFMEAEEAYEAGRVAEAIELLQEARRLHSEPVLLFNLARAYETAGRLDEAVDAFEQYLEEEPDADDRGAIETRVAAIRAQLEERRRLAEERADAEARAAERPAEDRSPSALPWLVLGVGAATVGAGVVFGLLAEDARNQAVDDPVHETAVASFARGEDFAIAANVLYAVGGAIAAAGLVWGVVDLIASGGGQEEDATATRIGIGPGSVFLLQRF